MKQTKEEKVTIEKSVEICLNDINASYKKVERNENKYEKQHKFQRK